MTLEIRGANIVSPDGILENGVLRIDGETIVGIGEAPMEADAVIEAVGLYAMAGFVDIHCHGGGGFDFMDSDSDKMHRIAEYHLGYGTTSLFATTMTDTYEAIESVLLAYASLDADERLTLEGVHLEGPWLAPSMCGAQSNERMCAPDPEKLKQLKEKYPFIKRVSAAPELPGGMELGRIGRSLGINMSAGHTAADFSDIEEAIENGYDTMTHFYSGMSGVYRKNAYRIAGAIEAGLALDGLTLEVIADGRHLPNELLRLIYKCRGADKICLVTDAMRGAGFPDGEKTVLGKLDSGTPCIIEDGVAKLYDRESFAGSVATADRLVRTMHSIGIPLTEVSKMASKTPSELMGLFDRGELVIGKRADIVLLNKDLEIKKVIFKGEIVE